MATTNPDEIWTPDSGDDYALTTDLAATADTVQIALNKYKNLFYGTNTERTNFTGPLRKEGVFWYVPSTGYMWQFLSGDWVNLGGYQPWTTLVAASGWTAGTGLNAPQVMKVGNTVWYRGSLYGGSAGTTATTLPEWARPSRTSRVWVGVSSGSAYMRIFTGGAVQPAGSIEAETQTSWSVA